MYNTELAKDYTLNDILNEVSEYDIYRYYIGKDIKLNRIMSSPLRSDTHPSFGIFKSKSSNQLLFKDQATGDSGNCVHFIMKLLNITYTEAIKQIVKDMLAGKVTLSNIGDQIGKLKPITTNILIQKRNWGKYDESYWGRYHITKEDLKLFNVFPIDRFWVNDVIQSYKYHSTNPMYAYQIFNKYKIYRPLADKSEKWRSNAGLYDIQGYEQLPDKCNHIIITKSLKDIIVLRKLGYYAIAPNGENHTIPQVVIDKLRKNKDTTKFTIFYDNDEAGQKACDKLKQKYNFYFIMLPYLMKFTEKGFINLDSKPKDISDYVELYGLEQAKLWLEYQLAYIEDLKDEEGQKKGT